MMQKEKIFERMGTLFITAVLALAPLSTAMADNNMPDPKKAGSITVHKYLRYIESTAIGTGKKLTAAEEAALGTPAPGVKFSLYKVKDTYEVTVNTTVAQARANSTLVSTKTTDSDGIIKWSWAAGAAGYYVLAEDPATAPEGYKAAPDSIIALPYAVNNDEWNYDIHVYPKNVSVKDMVKGVVEEKPGYSAGDVVEWKYTSKVNLSKIYTVDKNGDEAYGTYKITDTLDPRLDYTSTTSLIGKGGSADVTLSSPGDYKIDTTTARTVIWALTNTGIKKLAGVGATGLELTFKTKINDTTYGGSAAKEIKNGGKLEWKNTAGDENGEYTIQEPEKPFLKLYNIEIQKTSKDGSKLLDGAVFKIATSEANAKAGKFIQYDSNGDGTADKDVTVTTKAHPTDTAITGGWAMFAGLLVDEKSDTTFWLVEDVAPTTKDGKYIRPGEPIKVTILNSTGTTDAQKVTAFVSIKNYLPNDPDSPDKWKLPLTGGMGTLIFYVIGVVVMFGSVILFVRSKSTKATH